MQTPIHRRLVFFALLWPAYTWAGCEQSSVARLVAVQGEVLSQVGEDRGKWRPVAVEQRFCAGERVRTLDSSRATLELNNKTYLSLDQRTTLVFSGLKPHEPSWLDLLKGLIYVRSRTPSSLGIRTPFVNGVIRGTEFLVSSDEREGRFTLFEGRVDVSNAKGGVELASGEMVVARAGEAPVKKLVVSPRDGVQWALYYPPVIDLARLSRESKSPEVRLAVQRYLAGDLAGALAALPEGTEPTLRAGLLLSAGRVDEAQALLRSAHADDAEALALKSIIALARDDKPLALDLARQATAKAPNSPVGWTALSYGQQAQFDLEGALDSARKAAELSPDNGLTQTRLAELYASLGRRSPSREAAERAVQLSPQLGRAWAVQGFAQLSAMDTGRAQASFENAIRIDAADPLPHFGLGLAKIRRGELEAGTADLEIAASLDPGDSLTRSYLGKAYYEQKRYKIAGTELGIAKELDPKDPTPWFYEAIQKQTENRPVEALKDMQQAIELNDNRAVYRSKQLLDSDLAARSSAQGRIYNDLGFGQRALVEGWKSVNADPGDFSAHRFLADTYANQAGSEVARVSELLQSQLLQPLNVTPVAPHLAEANLLAFQGLNGPTSLSFNEFNPLFNRDRMALQVSGLAGSRGTLGDEVTQAGLWRNLSYSLGQFHYQTDGFRPNDQINQNIYNAFVQAAITPEFNVQFEARHRSLNYGDVSRNLFPGLAWTDDNQFETDTLRFGSRYSPSTSSDFIANIAYQKQRDISTGRAVRDGVQAEGQYQWRSDLIKTIAGGGYYSLDQSQAFGNFSDQFTRDFGNGYIYSHINFPSRVRWTLGLSVDYMSDPNFQEKRRSQVNPKLGMIWDITPDTSFRLAGFRSLKRTLLNEQTIEPTQIAGFNQFFDDWNGTDATRMGAALDHRFSSSLFAGAEVSTRELSIPAGSTLPRYDAQEQLYRTYLNWAPLDSLAVNLAYEYAIFDEKLDQTHTNNFAPNTRTHRVPLQVRYFHEDGYMASLGMTYYDQSGTGGFPVSQAESRFALFDLGLGYRLPKRYGIVRFEIRNLFDEHFDIQGIYFRSPKVERDAMLPWPERVFLGQVTLAF